VPADQLLPGTHDVDIDLTDLHCRLSGSFTIDLVRLHEIDDEDAAGSPGTRPRSSYNARLQRTVAHHSSGRFRVLAA
jgi:hypothetical protein